MTLMADYINKAKEAIYKATTKNGILASTSPVSNYQRVFSRDAVMTGVVGLLINDKIITQGLKESLLSLSKGQADTGQIPSNISFAANNTIHKISYGRLSAKIDANTWFVIGSALYILFTNDLKFSKQIKPTIQKTLKWLKDLELNGRGLTYVPEGGNWADEYIISGYTLYDQVLRYWALKKAGEVWEEDDWTNAAKHLRKLISINYWPDKKNINSSDIYHPNAFQRILKNKQINYFQASLRPSYYDSRFDLAGNTLALLLQISNQAQTQSVVDCVNQIVRTFEYPFPPVFWPVIKKDERGWQELSTFYLFQFKNHPNHYHNGGVWPVWLGWWSLALLSQGNQDRKEKLNTAMKQYLKKHPSYNFHEYLSSENFMPYGTQDLCFSASGIILLSNISFSTKLI